MPNSTALSPRWNRWRRERQSDLINQGLDRGNAVAIARAEAAARARLAVRTNIGFAESVRLILTMDEAGNMKAWAQGDDIDDEGEGIPEAFRERLQPIRTPLEIWKA